MKTLSIITATLLLSLTACKAPPSVQKVIDEAEAQKEDAKPRLVNPAITQAQSEGREVYDLYLKGSWAPEGQCTNTALLWEFKEDNFERPKALSDRDAPCKLEAIEALADQSYAVVGYCPRLKLADEPILVKVVRVDRSNIIIQGLGGGALMACP